MPRKMQIGVTTMLGPVSTTGAGSAVVIYTPLNKAIQAMLDVKGRTGVSGTVKIDASLNGTDWVLGIMTLSLSNSVLSDGWPLCAAWKYIRANITAFTLSSGGTGTPTITVLMGEE